MRNIFKKHKIFWSQKELIFNALVGAVFFAFSLLATYYANYFTTLHASNRATDLILDNLPVMNVDFIFAQGALIFIAIIAAIVFYEPRRIPFVLKSAALFILIRSIFVTLTHLASPLPQLYIDNTEFIRKFSSGDDLFFSAHTGMPFLFALMFWNDKRFRYFFIFSTIVGASAVLLGHLHYSIDVFSAFFIAYGIYHMALKFFPKDYKLFHKEDLT
jgi:hypothetical protein